MYPDHLKYYKEHTWVHLTDSTGVIGVTHFAQESLGRVVYIDLPQPGEEIKAGMVFGVIESMKAVSDLYAPVSGRILKVNEQLFDTPDLVNQDPYGNGWIMTLELSDLSELSLLFSAEEYQDLITND